MPNANHASMPAEQRSLNILVVEDSPEDLLLLESLIAPNHHIWSVNSATEAIELCLEQPPECVILDHLLPEMDGLALAAELRKNPNMRQVPIIMWTLFGSAEISVDVRKFGIDDQISKQNITAPKLQEMIHRNYQHKYVERERDTEHQALSHENQELARRHDLFADYWESQSHQLLTDLSSVQEFVSLLMDELPGPINEEQGKFLALARGGCVEIQRTIEKIQKVTKLENDAGQLVVQPENLQELVDSLLESKRLEALACGITLVTNDSKVPYVLSDRYALTQLLDTLLTAGFKMSPSGSELYLSISQPYEHHTTVAIHVVCEAAHAPLAEGLFMEGLQNTLNSANATNYRLIEKANSGVEICFDLLTHAEVEDKDAA